MRFTLFLAIFLAQVVITLPRFLMTCTSAKQPKAIAIYLVHNLTDVFLFWGPFTFTYPEEAVAHAVIAFGTVIHWLTNQNRCFLTVDLNLRCGWPEDLWFDSLLNRLNIRQINEYFQIWWILGLFALSIWRFKGHF